MADGDALAGLREKIDELDRRIVELLNARARIVIDIGKVKHQSGTPVYAPDREKIVLERIRAANRTAGGPLPDSCLEAIYRELMSGSFALEKPLRIAYLGPQGSFSHLASVKKFGSSVEHVPVVAIESVFDEVGRGHADLGLVPIENSTIGGIVETMDAFLEHPHVTIVAEALIAIHSHLLANCAPEEVKVIYSKAEPLNQCRNWLTATYRDTQRIAVASSSKAAEMATKETGAAAIGSSLAAELYNLKTLFANIEDNPNNVTRFFVIGKKGAGGAGAAAKRTGDDKTSIIFTTAHKSGALVDVLDVFRRFGINLTNIDTRPSQKRNFEYYFFVDMVGHIEDESLSKALEEVRTHCLQLAVLGSFPRAAEVL
ncbi:MAG TPA: prephenate dehydratase [Phycisphaerae bacterium]|jgi:chorismate mutase/prephenate dehydratase|nr:prephenate dehydratase [Phycisphaerae bacterium]